MATESGEVRLYLRFRTPLDAPKPGEAVFIFPSSGYTDSPFSGLYKIKSVRSKFHEGVFTQDLDLFRDRGQQPQEIANVRADPSLIAGSALIVDPRQQTFSSVVAPEASLTSGESVVLDNGVVVTPLGPQTKIESRPLNDPPKATSDPLDTWFDNYYRTTGTPPD
jgi:hypothetical protein